MLSNLNNTICHVSHNSDGIENAYSVQYKAHGSSTNSTSVNVYKNSINVVPFPDTRLSISQSVINNMQSFELDSKCILQKTHIDVYATCGDDSKPSKCYPYPYPLYTGCWYSCCDDFSVNVSKTCQQHVHNLTPRSRLVLDGCAKNDSVCDSCAFVRPPDTRSPGGAIPQPRTDIVV